jgi:hypothetical protein
MIDHIPTEALRLVKSTAFQVLVRCSFLNYLVSSFPIGAEIKILKKNRDVFWVQR